MSAKTTFFAAAISLTLGGCCCPPNPCCQVGAPAYAPAFTPAVMAPGLPAAMCAPLTAAFTCNGQREPPVARLSVESERRLTVPVNYWQASQSGSSRLQA